MNKYILACDIGYGYTKYCVMNENGNIIKLDKVVSGITEVQPNQYDSLVNTEELYYNWKNKRYLIGDLSSKLMIDPVDVLEYDGFKLVSSVMISYLMSFYKDGQFDKVAVGITPAMNDKRDDYQKYLEDELGITVELYIQGISGHHTYNKYGLSLSDLSKIDLSEKTDSYLGIDIGHNTIDYYICINNIILDHGIKGDLNKGIIIITNKIKDFIFAKLGKTINDVEAKEILLRKGIKKRGKLIDYSQTIDKFIIEYLTSTIDRLESEYGEQMDKLDNILLMGGGAGIISNSIKTSDTIKETIDDLYGDDFLLIPNEKPEYYNVIGYAIQSSNK